MSQTFLILLIATACAMPADAATATKKAKPTTASHSTAPKAPAAKPSAPAPPTEGRTLGDIHIEGEIATPQVLFITARDQRRIVDLNHRRYLETSREVGERTILPSRIGPIVKPPVAGKETQR